MLRAALWNLVPVYNLVLCSYLIPGLVPWACRYNSTWWNRTSYIMPTTGDTSAEVSSDSQKVIPYHYTQWSPEAIMRLICKNLGFWGRCTTFAAPLLALLLKIPSKSPKDCTRGFNSMGPRRKCPHAPLFPIEGENVLVLRAVYWNLWAVCWNFMHQHPIVQLRGNFDPSHIECIVVFQNL